MPLLGLLPRARRRHAVGHERELGGAVVHGSKLVAMLLDHVAPLEKKFMHDWNVFVRRFTREGPRCLQTKRIRRDRMQSMASMTFMSDLASLPP